MELMTSCMYTRLGFIFDVLNFFVLKFGVLKFVVELNSCIIHQFFSKINFDVSVVAHIASRFYFERSFFGKPHITAQKKIGDVSVLVAEALTLRESLHMVFLQ